MGTTKQWIEVYRINACGSTKKVFEGGALQVNAFTRSVMDAIKRELKEQGYKDIRERTKETFRSTYAAYRLIRGYGLVEIDLIKKRKTPKNYDTILAKYNERDAIVINTMGLPLDKFVDAVREHKNTFIGGRILMEVIKDGDGKRFLTLREEGYNVNKYLKKIAPIYLTEQMAFYIANGMRKGDYATHAINIITKCPNDTSPLLKAVYAMITMDDLTRVDRATLRASAKDNEMINRRLKQWETK